MKTLVSRHYIYITEKNSRKISFFKFGNKGGDEFFFFRKGGGLLRGGEEFFTFILNFHKKEEYENDFQFV